MSLDEQLRHDDVVNKLVSRLRDSKRYTKIKVYYHYYADRRHGEADVVALNDKSIHYYEVKGKYHPNNYAKALSQFEHFSKANLHLPVKYIYVSKYYVERVYL